MECSICYMDLLDDPKYTECNHVYCINCICKIKKCSMCRRELNHVNMCREIIKQNCEIIKKNLPRPIYTFDINPETFQPSGLARFDLLLGIMSEFTTPIFEPNITFQPNITFENID